VSEPGFINRDQESAIPSAGAEDGASSTFTENSKRGRILQSARRPDWVLNVVLFAATLVTTTVFGYGLVRSFSSGHVFDLDWIFEGYGRLWHAQPGVWSGIRFSIPLLLILLAHEFGHFFECTKWRVNATLPFFLPSPTLFGTLGAFIRIRSPIYTRCGLFDIGVSGPIAGFVVLLPFLVCGISVSHTLRFATAETFTIGTPLLMRLVEYARFPGVPASHIALHPLAVAAWGGLLATAINLLPVGQLDGGHIVYAVLGYRWHRVISNVSIAALVVLGFFYWAWWIWAAVLFFFGRRHPLVYDESPLDTRRKFLAAVALLIFLLSFTIVPVRVA
jgi:membrane-associated protease RseP (regulator of RpoE activity)